MWLEKRRPFENLRNSRIPNNKLFNSRDQRTHVQVFTCILFRWGIEGGTGRYHWHFCVLQGPLQALHLPTDLWQACAEVGGCVDRVTETAVWGSRAVCSRVSSQCEAWSFCPLFCWSKVLCRLFGGWPWSQVLTGGCLWGMHAAGPRCILVQFWSDGGLFCFYCSEWRHTTCTVGKGFVAFVSPCWMRPWVSHDLETIVLPCWLLIDVHLTIAPSRSFDCGRVEVLYDLDESWYINHHKSMWCNPFYFPTRNQDIKQFCFTPPASSLLLRRGNPSLSLLVGGHLRAELGRLFVSAQSLLAARGQSGRAAELDSAMFFILFFRFPTRFVLIVRHHFFCIYIVCMTIFG